MRPNNPQSTIRHSQLHCGFCALIASLILTLPAAAGEARHPDAVTIFQCQFGDDWDVNYDRWPDRWVRKTGPSFPHYVAVAIADDVTALGAKALKIDLDGAAAAVSSPPIRVMPRFSYVFEARLKNERLKHSTVVITLDFRDSSGRVLQTERSEPFSTTKGWELVRLGPIEPSDPAIDRVVFGLQVLRSNKGDLKGEVSLADVWLARLPRISVSTNNPCNVYSELDGVVVRCELSGIRERDPEIRFQLFDALNIERQNYQSRLNGRLIVDDAARAAGITDGVGQAPDGYEGAAEWNPKIPDYGYYRVVVRMLSSESAEGQADADRQLASSTIHLAVAPPLPIPRRSEFGWTLPHGEGPLTFQDLSRLLAQVGINWVKVPVWFDADDPDRGNELIRFVELLGASNIEVVGIIDRPPATTEFATRIARNTPIAELLSLDSSAWSASLEPVMARLSLRVRWWQLGDDRDLSFVGFPMLNKRIEELRTALFRFGQDVRIGVNWDWADDEPLTGKVAWNFQQLTLETPPTEEEFTKLLAKPRENSAQRWISVLPPARANDSGLTSEESLLARSSEFIRRLVSAKIHGVDAIIVSDPFNDDNGVMRASGMPGELLLPWRTTALMLGGAEYLGQMQLPAGSDNRIFLRPDGQVVMVVWNHEPTQEKLYLGREVRQIDIFGRSTQPAEEGREQVIPVSPTPTFVLGLNEAITRWRMAVAFEKHQVPSVFAKPHRNSLRIQNFFPQGVGGSLKIVVVQDRHMDKDGSEDGAGGASGFIADRWTIDPPQGTFQLAAGEELQFPFEIRLKNALFGEQPVRIDFKVEADEEYQFSVYRQMEVGTEDLTLDVTTRLDKDGTLIIEQLMTNSADRLADFRCYLHAKGHRRQRMQVYRLGPSVDRKVYRFVDGQDLVGQEMLLEIEELNGPRMLKYRFVVSDQSTESNETNDTGAEKTLDAPGENTADEDAHLANARS